MEENYWYPGVPAYRRRPGDAQNISFRRPDVPATVSKPRQPDPIGELIGGGERFISKEQYGAILRNHGLNPVEGETWPGFQAPPNISASALEGDELEQARRLVSIENDVFRFFVTKHFAEMDRASFRYGLETDWFVEGVLKLADFGDGPQETDGRVFARYQLRSIAAAQRDMMGMAYDSATGVLLDDIAKSRGMTPEQVVDWMKQYAELQDRIGVSPGALGVRHTIEAMKAAEAAEDDEGRTKASRQAAVAFWEIALGSPTYDAGPQLLGMTGAMLGSLYETENPDLADRALGEAMHGDPAGLMRPDVLRRAGKALARYRPELSKHILPIADKLDGIEMGDVKAISSWGEYAGWRADFRNLNQHLSVATQVDRIGRARFVNEKFNPLFGTGHWSFISPKALLNMTRMAMNPWENVGDFKLRDQTDWLRKQLDPLFTVGIGSTHSAVGGLYKVGKAGLSAFTPAGPDETDHEVMKQGLEDLAILGPLYGERPPRYQPHHMYAPMYRDLGNAMLDRNRFTPPAPVESELEWLGELIEDFGDDEDHETIARIGEWMSAIGKRTREENEQAYLEMMDRTREKQTLSEKVGGVLEHRAEELSSATAIAALMAAGALKHGSRGIGAALPKGSALAPLVNRGLLGAAWDARSPLTPLLAAEQAIHTGGIPHLQHPATIESPLLRGAMGAASRVNVPTVMPDFLGFNVAGKMIGGGRNAGAFRRGLGSIAPIVGSEVQRNIDLTVSERTELEALREYERRRKLVEEALK